MQQGSCWASADEMSPEATRLGERLGLHGMLRRVWAPRGVKVRQRRQIVYRWQYLALAVDSVQGQLFWAWLDNVKKETMAELVKSWKRRGIEALVWDGSGSHRARLVREAGMKLIGLPPYAPELNPAERVFEEIRGKTEGRPYENLEDKRAAADAILQEMASDAKVVRQLAGWDWIQEAHQHLPS